MKLSKCFSTFIFNIFLFPFLCLATQYEPWFDNVLELQVRSGTIFQHYGHIRKNSTMVRKLDNVLTRNLSLAIAPLMYLNFEAEINLTRTHNHDFALEDTKFTGRYLIFDDVMGDPYSLTAGLSLTLPTYHFRHDISLFHSGPAEWEAHMALGKEYPCEDRWQTRWWALGGIGIANRGSPWLRADINWERNFCERHQFRLYAKSLWGLGDHTIQIDDSFPGYGSIRHQTIDVGGRYSYLLFFPCGYLKFLDLSRLEIEYAYRVYAQNAPATVHTVTLFLHARFSFF